MGKKNDESFVLGPAGERLTRADLPDANTARWTARRKAEVVAAVEGGLISRKAAVEEYHLSEEEYDSWKSAFSLFGVRGLSVTRTKAVRNLIKRNHASASC